MRWMIQMQMAATSTMTPTEITTSAQVGSQLTSVGELVCIAVPGYSTGR